LIRTEKAMPYLSMAERSRDAEFTQSGGGLLGGYGVND
jgi:hypothetical protein